MPAWQPDNKGIPRFTRWPPPHRDNGTWRQIHEAGRGACSGEALCFTATTTTGHEWAALGGRKRPFCFSPWDERPWAFAGLWERWEGPDGPVESCAILTTGANELVRSVHDRMPVILPERHWAAWLDAALQEAGEVVPLLRPSTSDAMRAYPVGQLVSNPRNDGPECLEPV